MSHRYDPKKVFHADLPEQGKIGSIYEFIHSGKRLAWDQEIPGDYPDEIFYESELLYLGNGWFFWLEHQKRIFVLKESYLEFGRHFKMLYEAE